MRRCVTRQSATFTGAPASDRAVTGVARGIRFIVSARRNLKKGLDMPTEKDVRRALRRVKDPELNLDLVVLGLIYDISIHDEHVKVTISLTSPFCPAANQIIEDTKGAIEGVEGVHTAEVELTFDPQWTPERIDPVIRASLGI